MAAEVKAKFEGKWTVCESENFEAFLEKMGVNIVKKKIALQVKPSLELSVDGDKISINISAGPVTNKVSFQLGETFKTDAEYTGQAVTEFTDGKLVTKGSPNEGKLKGETVTVVREISGDQLIQTMSVGDVTAKRIFKKAK
ncbi:fatty acid-binding protein, intestinal-like [Ruditapes philippinarum]|uniref:fatty acid-binding protein, intestinal-like n=1 Tax=Ruditapes philippinarum TaxID=129788 RepID=UPI00295B9452|nr:fatty acid-binding protein, intestinal-like [Ruditapes philippinarum]